MGGFPPAGLVQGVPLHLVAMAMGEGLVAVLVAAAGHDPSVVVAKFLGGSSAASLARRPPLHQRTCSVRVVYVDGVGTGTAHVRLGAQARGRPRVALAARQLYLQCSLAIPSR